MTTAKIKWDWATKREKPVAAKIKLQDAFSSIWFFDETTVTFALGGPRNFTAGCPTTPLTSTRKWLKAIIVGDYDNGDWKILIPEETFQSTIYLRVPKAEQGTTVVEGWW